MKRCPIVFQEIFGESAENLNKAIEILSVEPEGKEELQEEMERLSKMLEDVEEE